MALPTFKPRGFAEFPISGVARPSRKTTVVIDTDPLPTNRGEIPEWYRRRFPLSTTDECRVYLALNMQTPPLKCVQDPRSWMVGTEFSVQVDQFGGHSEDAEPDASISDFVISADVSGQSMVLLPMREYWHNDQKRPQDIARMERLKELGYVVRALDDIHVDSPFLIQIVHDVVILGISVTNRYRGVA